METPCEHEENPGKIRENGQMRGDKTFGDISMGNQGEVKGK